MTENEKEMMNSIFAKIAELDYIKPDEIPNIALYMDQVTTFMEDNLASTKRHNDDKILTKTMINNYAKNRLLPAPVRKKYNKEHILLLLFIYYYKSLLSISDIEQLFRPVTEQHFNTADSLTLSDIYEEVFSREALQMEHLKDDIRAKFEDSRQTFTDIEGEDQEYLQLFSFISELSFDVYLKKHMIEMLIDQLREEVPLDPKAKKAKK